MIPARNVYISQVYQTHHCQHTIGSLFWSIWHRIPGKNLDFMKAYKIQTVDRLWLWLFEDDNSLQQCPLCYLFCKVAKFLKLFRQMFHVIRPVMTKVNTLRPRQNGRCFADDIFKRIFFNENVWISIQISLKFVPKGPINKIPALLQIMAWRHPGDKPLSEAMLVNLLTQKCVTRPQWVKCCTNLFH